MKLADLAAEFPKEAVHWRAQGTPHERNGRFSAMALAYIDARDVMDRLDAVCGPDGWQSHIEETPSGRVLCRLGIKVGDEWVWKTDGAGGTQVEAEKGGISDSLKRAAVSWGVGRYLYRLDSPWVGCEVKQNNGKTYWKRWTEDPWSKVQRSAFVPPKVEPEPEAPSFDANAAFERINKRLAAATSLDALQSAWKAEWATVQEIGAVNASWQKTLTDTKDRVKASLTASSGEVAA